MKKILLTAIACLALFSCASNRNEKINFDIVLDNIPVNFGGGKKIDVVVIDERGETEILGKKKVGEDFVTLRNEQNLPDIIKEALLGELVQKGFAINQGEADKIMEVRLVKLDYSGKRAYFTGHSSATVLIRVTVKDRANITRKYQRNYGLSIDRDHFIMPTKKSDQGALNYVIEETLNDVFRDQDLLQILKN